MITERTIFILLLDVISKYIKIIYIAVLIKKKSLLINVIIKTEQIITIN